MTRRLLWIVAAMVSLEAGGLDREVAPRTQCLCLFRSAKEAWKDTPAIFIGHIERVETTRHASRKWSFTHPAIPAYDTFKAWIRVDESFKGTTVGDVFIHDEEEDCNFAFQDKDKGGQWLFYTRRYPASPVIHFGCSRTRRLQDAGDDLLFLRSLPDSDRKNRLSGTVSRLQDLGEGMFDRTVNVGDVRITVVGESTDREIKTDRNGAFEVTGLTPGKYRVELDVPNADSIYLAYSIGGSARRMSNGQSRERTQSVFVGADDGVEVDFVLIAKASEQRRKSHR